jgi:hypothetical protein
MNMKPQSDDEIIAVLKRVYPRAMKSADKGICPTEDALASFAEGILKGKKQEKLISHLAFCERCLDTVKFLRQKPMEEDVSVPAWLQNTVKNLVPEKPKTFEIVVTTVKEALQVLSTTAREFFGVPEPVLARLGIDMPGQGASRTGHFGESRFEIQSDEADETSWERSFVQKLAPEDLLYSSVESSRRIPEDFDHLVSTLSRSLAKHENEKAVLEALRKKLPKGVIFHENMGAFEVYVAIDKAGKEQPNAFAIRIEVRDPSGKPAEDVEVAFMEGRKVVSKFTSKKDAEISKTLKPGRYRIRFNFKELYLGQVLLDLRKEEQK